MVKSMTGYGRMEGVFGNKKVLAEIRSVNHRFADYNIKVPRHYGFLEDKVRGFAAGFITRGKVDIYVAMESYGEGDKQVTLNLPLAQSYVAALRQLGDALSLTDDISIASVARYTDIFATERKQEDAEELWGCVQLALAPALEQFMEMRGREGEKLCADIRSRAATMCALIREIETRSPQCVEEYRTRLTERIRETVADRNIDESRVLTEAAIFSDKIAVAEETVRLHSHFAQMETILAAPEPAGRKLDFLIQEINREINTIGSKCNDLSISKLVVELKAELEKMREQVQNIE